MPCPWQQWEDRGGECTLPPPSLTHPSLVSSQSHLSLSSLKPTLCARLPPAPPATPERRSTAKLVPCSAVKTLVHESSLAARTSTCLRRCKRSSCLALPSFKLVKLFPKVSARSGSILTFSPV